MEREMRITKEEIDIIKSTFKKNTKLLKLMRKIFLPEISVDAPLGQNIDLWMTIPIENQDPQSAYINLVARNQLIRHIETQLLQLQILAETDARTLEEAREAIKKDSAR